MTNTEPTPNDSTLDDLQELESALSETLFDNFDTGYYIGMMSGTSLDGMDAVICQFDESDNEKIIATHTKPFPEYLRDTLLALCQPNGITNLSHPVKNIILEQQPHSELEWFGWASREYAEFASTVVNELLQQSGISADDILAIGCHGQTVRHRPKLGFSLQLVDPNVIAERTGISVVTDFRRRDMAVGGQGAPLAPAFHLALFADATQSDKDLIVVNLGGIANITVLPAKQADKVIGYDTGPANILLDAWYQDHHPDSTTLYDDAGQWAQSGTVNSELLTQFMAHPYFGQSAPKSTGREEFNLGWLTQQLEQFSLETKQTVDAASVQATLTQLTSQSLCEAIQIETDRLSLQPGNLIVCGGGAYNPNLIAQIAKQLPEWQVATSQEFGVSPTWVEAMAFAWLARQTIMGQAGNLPAVTGASKDVVLGQVCFA
ncbi:Anhydro-N-acetylmuramic acid kinase [Psychrobacter pasteurii]|uniref:Anhydro-N-acetylmuramic acid kinase n=1 Tax=Psychrobacter pasteurii TaxID=1945520 RepID=A0A1R4EI63_9GAMM|nr:anhydro-N-acetylmuramic acid kinase [Psychrobacter pasteurii]SJM38089.1 Anhydro-N-acetylmuramic acid kinase [Psychrobacter pasteurii]